MENKKLALFKQDGEVYYVTDIDAQDKILNIENNLKTDYAKNDFINNEISNLRNEINDAKFSKNYSDLIGIPDLSIYATNNDLNSGLETKQDKLENGISIKTINGQDVLGSGDIRIDTDLSDYITTAELNDRRYVDEDTLIEKDYVSKAELDEKGYLTEHQSLEEYALKSEVIKNEPALSINKGVAGTKCFKILFAKDDGDTGGTYVLDTIDGIEPGMTYNVIMSETKISWGIVISVGDHVAVEGQTPTNNGVRVTNYYDMPLNENDDDVHNVFYITGHPELGSHEINKPSVSFGGFSPVEGTISTGTSSAAGKYSAAFGKETIAGYQSISAGFESEAIGFTSAAFNQQNKVRSQAGFATGANNTLKDNATAAFATGYNTVSDSECQIVAGRFNKEADGARITGNGSDGNRKNIEQLDWDGNVWFAGDVYLGSTSGIEKDEGSVSVLNEINDIKKVLEKNYYDITFSGLENCTAIDNDGNVIEVGTPIVVKKFNGCYDFEFTPTANEGYEVGKDTDLIVAGTFESAGYSKKKGIYEIKNIGSNITCKLIARSGTEVGYNVTFAPIDGEITVYSTNDFSDIAETLSAESTWTTQTRHKNTGTAAKSDSTDEEGKNAAQVNFVIKPAHGYSVKNITVDGTKKNVKAPDQTDIENGYSITQVGSDLTITVELEEINKTLNDYNIKNVYTKEEIDAKVPTKNSSLENDSGFISDVSDKQDLLVSGINIKTVNGNSLLGEGDIIITPSETPDLSDYATQSWVEAKGYLTEHQSLSNYALKSEVIKNEPALSINNGVAGTKCFKILFAKDDGDTGGTYVLDTIDGIEPGMIYNVIMSETKISWGTVISVGVHVEVEGQTPTNNGVRVTNYYQMALNENDDDTHNIFYITEHPELGSHEIKKSSVSFGGFSPVEGTISSGTSSAAGKYGAAFGKKTIAGYQSISAGFESEAIGFTSAAFNQQNKVRSQAGVATGANNTLKNNATAAFATGYNNISDSECQIVAGRFNKEIDGARVTGNGTDGNRKNIEVLDWDGNLTLNGRITINNNQTISGITDSTGTSSTTIISQKGVSDNYALKSEIPSIDNLATKTELSTIENKIPVVPSNISTFNNDIGYITSAALDGYAKTDSIPTKTSQLTNDSNFLTTIPESYAKKADLPKIIYSTDDIIAGTTELEDGALYFVYEE